MECAGLINITNRELCPDDYMWASIVQYSDLISLQYAGFHPQKCRGRSLSIYQLPIEKC